MYRLLVWFFSVVLRVFFSDVEVVGLENVPKDGAVIFTGNHQNQFVDGLMLLTTCGRDISFLIAEKSFHRPVVGFFAKMVHAIPVKRRQDVAKMGKGLITAAGEIVTGYDTMFTKEVNPGDQIAVSGDQTIPTVKQVVSNTELILDRPFARVIPREGRSYKVLEKIDQNAMFSSVYEVLGRGGTIGIFPEGGSHDRTQLLPLKAGVSMMALGTVAMKQTPVYIVPCGLNYFAGHRFRSNVMVEFGQPIIVNPDDPVAVQYRSNKRDACSTLLKQIEDRLRSVTLNVPDYQLLRCVHTVRRLYRPTNIQLSVEQYLELNRRFAEGFAATQNDPKVKRIVAEVVDYNEKLQRFGLKDRHIEREDLGDVHMLWILIARVVYLVLLMLLAFPGLVLNAPIGGIAKLLALREAKKSQKASDVKIEGKDVIASYKIIVGLVLVPCIYFFYGLIVAFFWGLGWGMASVAVLPFISYASVIVLEEGYLVWKASIPLLFSFIHSSYRQQCMALRQQRTELRNAIREAVEEFGPKVLKDFEEKRMITPKMHDLHKPVDGGSRPFLRPRYQSYKKGASSGDLLAHAREGEVSWDDLVDWETS